MKNGERGTDDRAGGNQLSLRLDALREGRCTQLYGATMYAAAAEEEEKSIIFRKGPFRSQTVTTASF